MSRQEWQRAPRWQAVCSWRSRRASKACEEGTKRCSLVVSGRELSVGDFQQTETPSTGGGTLLPAADVSHFFMIPLLPFPHSKQKLFLPQLQAHGRLAGEYHPRM